MDAELGQGYTLIGGLADGFFDENKAKTESRQTPSLFQVIADF